MIIKITNCTVYYKNGKIRNNQNIKRYFKDNIFSLYTKEQLLNIYISKVHSNSINTEFTATLSSKITIED
jgi:hypothetical protein